MRVTSDGRPALAHAALFAAAVLSGCSSHATSTGSTATTATSPTVTVRATSQATRGPAERPPGALGSAPIPLEAATPAIGTGRERVPTNIGPRHVAVAYVPHGVRPMATPFGILRPHDPPQIYHVSMSTGSAGAGETVSGTVSTSSNVASVVASVAGISSGVPKVGVGQFAMSYTLPPVIPPFAKGTYSIVVVARNVDGTSTSRSVAITLH